MTGADEEYKGFEYSEAKKRLQYIIDLGYDYDGFNTIESLKGLIDEMVEAAKGNYPDEV